MKLQTMLLPTGEFALVISEAGGTDPAAYRENLLEFRDAAGAAALFITDQEVTVENALVDEGTHRAGMNVVTWKVNPGEVFFDSLNLDVNSKPWKPFEGDRVLLHGVSMGGRAVEGHTGTIVEVDHDGLGVALDKPFADVAHVLVTPGQIEPLPVSLSGEPCG